MAQAPAQMIVEADHHRIVHLGTGDPALEKGISSNQYLIVDQNVAYLIDPGGYHVFSRTFANTTQHISVADIGGIILTHQDPDVCVSLSSWLEARPDVEVIVSGLWERFLSHLFLPCEPNYRAIPDIGASIELPSGASLELIPAHYLHSPGNFSIYDGAAKVLFSGDIGASPSTGDTLFVEDFDAHTDRMVGFHTRYMSSNAALRRWVGRVRELEIDIVCPQHGQMIRGEDVGRFFDWLARIEVGVDSTMWNEDAL